MPCEMPTKLALEGVKHIILYLSGTSTYGLLLAYQVPSTSKLEEIHGKEMNTHTGERVEAFSDSDWAGDKSKTMREGIQSLLARSLSTAGL